MHSWFGWGHAIWMTIGWLTVVALFFTIVWSIVLSATLRFEERQASETHASGVNKNEDTRSDAHSNAA